MAKAIHKTIYIYKGKISYSIKLGIIKEILSLDYIKDGKPAFRKKVRYVADECITNILNYYTIHHLLDKNCSAKVISVGQKIKLFEFENVILTKDVPVLKEKINHINQADLPEKNNLFINALKKDLDKEAKGAGLGILTLKQKLNCSLKPSFSKAASGFYKFKLKVLISDY